MPKKKAIVGQVIVLKDKGLYGYKHGSHCGVVVELILGDSALEIVHPIYIIDCECGDRLKMNAYHFVVKVEG